MDATKDTPDEPDTAVPDSTDRRIADLEREVADLKESRLRAVADLQNTARRGVENESRARTQGVMGAARAIFPVLDNVDVALQQKAMSAEQAVQGLAMLRDQLLKGLESVGVERIEPAVGEPFDPGVHEAVMRQAAEGVEPGCVSMVFQGGYRIGESILRPAKVAVHPSE